MQVSKYFLFTVLSVVSLGAFAEHTGKPSFDKFSYQGVKFTDSFEDIRNKHFLCNKRICESKQEDQTVVVSFSHSKITQIDVSTTYRGDNNCADDIDEIKRYLIETLDAKIEPTPTPLIATAIVIQQTENPLKGTISTDKGLVGFGLRCSRKSGERVSYLNVSFSLKDVLFQNFKDSFTYE